MRRYGIPGIVVILLVALVGVAPAWAGTALAPIYPGAVADPHGGDVTVQVYLSHDSLGQVTSWYAGKVGTLSKEAGNTLWNADGEDQIAGRPLGLTDPQVETARLGRVTMAQSAVARSLKDMTRTKDVGVLCEGMQFQADQSDSPVDASASSGSAKAEAMQRRMEQMQQKLQQLNQQMTASLSPADRAMARMGDLFEGLKQEVAAGNHGHTKQDLLAVYKKYKHLETAWYPAVKTGDGVTSYDRWLLARERQKLKGQQASAAAPAEAGAKDMQALAAKVQAALAAGRMDQVQALSRQMQSAMQAQQGKSTRAAGVILKDRWNFWLAFLKKLDAHAYRTRILVNTSPKSWGY